MRFGAKPHGRNGQTEDERFLQSGTFPVERVEARSNERTAVNVCVNVFSDHNFWSGLAMNMSEGGIFIATYDSIAIGTQLELHIILPFEEEPIITNAEVRWRREFSGPNDAPPGLGLKFSDLDALALGKVRRFVAAIREPLLFEE